MVFVMLAILLGVLCGPTIYVLRSRGVKARSLEGVKYLCSEVAAVIILVSVADAAGLNNPGGLILASIALVSLSGFFLARKYSAKHS